MTAVRARVPDDAPAWYREVMGSLGIASQFVLEGNVFDRYLLPSGEDQFVPVRDLPCALWMGLVDQGFEVLFCFDPTTGLRVHDQCDVAPGVVREILGRDLSQPMPQTLAAFGEDLVRIVNTTRRAAVVVERTSRLADLDGHYDEVALTFFRLAERMALSATAAPAGDGRSVGLFNPVFWTVDRDRQIPTWLLDHTDRVRSIALPLPDYGERERLVAMLLRRVSGWNEADESDRGQAVARFTQQTEGMTLSSLFSIVLLADDADLGLDRIDDAARAYRVGILDNPWRTDHLRARLRNGEETLTRQVLGQRDAVRKSLDIMVRSATGLTGAQGSPYGTRPRGVLFFAGPTGVGKTELAKQLTRMIFGDERAYIRFDMSEFSQEHTAARLIGAPPGYVGHDAGGELTNAIRQRPFSLVLFDEIEKADGRILDKFLQILEDGRLTDGRGATVFFSEAVIVFTSNLGIWVESGDGTRTPNVTRGDSSEHVEESILSAIKDHFTRVLGRPELLNRIGDNIVVFDFISDEVGRQILDLQLRNVVSRVERELGANLTIDPAARASLEQYVLSNLENGGRGVASVVENALVNPLARALFARESYGDGTIAVRAIRPTGRTFEVDLG